MNALTIGILFALIAALSSGIEKIFRRHVAIKVDAVTYGFVFGFVGAIAMLPFYLAEFEIPYNAISWTLLLIPSFLWAGTSYFLLKGYKHLEASIASPLSRIKILIVLALSIIFLNETLSINKLFGTIIIFAGLLFLGHKKTGKALDPKNKGVWFIVLAVTFTAAAHVFEKAGLSYLNPGIFAFSSYFIPMLIFLPFFMAKNHSFKSVYKNRFWPLVVTGILSAIFHYFILVAFKFAEASIVIPISEVSSLVAVFGGIIFLKERSHMAKKIISTIIVIAGTILISIS